MNLECEYENQITGSMLLALLEHMVAFSVLFNGLKPQKPLVVKLEKRNQNTFKGIT